MTDRHAHPSTAEEAAENAFVITRALDAPRDLVFAAHTDRAHLMRWWGPKGFTVQACEVDLRPGGLFRYGLRSPDGQEMWGRFVYREITAPERLVYVVSFTDETGDVIRHPWNPTWPLETLATTTFADQGDRTTLSVRWVPINATETERQTFAAGHESMRQGWTGTIDQLAAYLAER